MTEGVGFGLLTTSDKLQTVDYKSTGSNQQEIRAYLHTDGDTDWHVLYTVPAGKMLYVSYILVSTSNAGLLISFATGAAGVEVNTFTCYLTNSTRLNIPLVTPMKYDTGTIISVRQSAADHSYFVIVGWLQ